MPLVKKIICLMGPTASGKTKLAIELFKQLPCDIISVDSAMVYRGLDIGTSKPTAKMLSLVPHHLIDIRDPVEPYSVADFCADAIHTINAIVQQGRIPLLVGGTMLYFHALQQGLSLLPSADLEVRKRLRLMLEQQGAQALYDYLTRVDPVAAARIHPHDPQRLQRALEVYEITGRPMSELQQSAKKPLNSQWQFINLVLMPADRNELHRKISQRFANMLACELVDEVKKLFLRTDLNLETPALRAVGYKQVWRYLAGEYDRDTMCAKAIAATRQLAKRQLTWLRSWRQATVFDGPSAQLPEQILTFLVNKSVHHN